MTSLSAKTTAGTDTALEEASVNQLKASLSGELLVAGDDSYDATRMVFNAMIDNRPAMIVRCAGTADVVESVNFARAHDLLVAIRGGGHNVGGKSVCDGGLLIDLSRMKGIRVDPVRLTARAHPGRVRPRDAGVRLGYHARNSLSDGHCGPDPGRWHRLAQW